MWKRRFIGNQKAYAIYRMGIAMDRLAASNLPEEKRQAARWAAAWCAAGGGSIVSRLKLRDTRCVRSPGTN